MPGYARNPDAIADDVLVFPDAATRAISLPSPMPSQITYLEDTKLVQYWDGALWRAVGGGASYSTTAPSNPQVGDVWIDSDATADTLNENDYKLKSDAILDSDYSLLWATMGVM